MFIDVPEGRLHVVVAGDRGDPVLLLSGAGVDNAMLSWRHLMPVLSKRHRVFALDWPKQGASRPWNGRADYGRMLRCISDVLDHLDLYTVDLVGLSQGGALALGYAITKPERVTKLVVLAPAGIISFVPGVHQLMWLSAKASPLLTYVTTWLFRRRAMVVQLARRGLFAGPVTDFDEIVDEIHNEVLENGAGSSDFQNASIGFFKMKVDLRPHLDQIRCPTLFIQGDKDVAVRRKHTAKAAKRVRGARYEVLKGNGHWSNRQSPEVVNRLIADFLAQGREAEGT